MPELFNCLLLIFYAANIILLIYGSFAEEAFSIKSYVGFYPESAKFPIIKLTYSRSFGNTKIKVQRSMETSDNRRESGKIKVRSGEYKIITGE